jgi:hypothetical protein
LVFVNDCGFGGHCNPAPKQASKKNYSPGTIGTGTGTIVLCPELFLSGDFDKVISKKQIKLIIHYNCIE